MSLGQRIRNSREALKITQQEIAEALGVSPQHISGIEQEKFAPSVSILPGLAQELGVTTDYLLSGNDSVITDIIPAIKADKRLTLKAKKMLIGLIEELWV